MLTVPQGDLALAHDEIHLWVSDYARVTDDCVHARYMQLLAPNEREQQRRFVFARDRLRYLVTRALVRTVLSRYVPVPPLEWIFEPDGHGRPVVTHPDALSRVLSFNISHTHSLIVLGVARGRAIGVDVECSERYVSIDLSDRFFAPDEARHLRMLPVHEQGRRFFEYWTLKEAYIKARGMGLSIPLDKFGFQFPSATTLTQWIDPALNDVSSRWRFWQLRHSGRYLICICAEDIPDRATKLQLRSCIPLMSEASESIDCLRTSHGTRAGWDATCR